MNPDIFVVIEHLRGQVADISYVMLAAARVLANATRRQSDRGVARSRCRTAGVRSRGRPRDCIWNIAAFADFSSDAYQRALEGLLKEQMPRAVLFGDTTIGGDVAAWLSTHLTAAIGECVPHRSR